MPYGLLWKKAALFSGELTTVVIAETPKYPDRLRAASNLK
jgi:hypothetical protein